MRGIVLSALVLLLLFPAASSYGLKANGRDSAKCGALTENEAKELLKNILPPFNVLGIKPTPVKTMWEVDIESGGRKGLLYIDCSKRYLFSGNLVDIRTKENLTRTSFEEINRVDVSQIPLGDALLLGEKTAAHKVIVFDDPS